MKYLTAQPDRTKFYWQLKVQLANFKEIGIPLSDVIILVGCDVGDPSEQMKSLAETGAKIFFYPYERYDNYLSSVRPHIMKQHFKAFPELKDEYIFFLDSDVIFSRLPDYSKMNFDGSWYVSDTRNYIDSRFCIAHGPQLFMDMCKSVGIEPDLVRAKDDQAGGAQYIMHGVDAEFFEKVERDCIELMETHQRRMPVYNALGEKDIQIWCSDMWALLWNAWLRGKNTIITDELSFSWAHSNINFFYQRPILHMAGVTAANENSDNGPHFNKAKWDRKSPFGRDHSHVSTKSASYKYVEYINKISS